MICQNSPALLTLKQSVIYERGTDVGQRTMKWNVNVTNSFSLLIRKDGDYIPTMWYKLQRYIH